jgi:hypothetical protein
MGEMGEVFFLLVFSHYLFDFGLQSEYVAKGKNRYKPLPGVPWFHCLAAHSVMHGGGVYLATGNPILGILETAVHFAIDDQKCRGRLGYHVDQALHIGCKVLWIYLLFNSRHHHQMAI